MALFTNLTKKLKPTDGVYFLRNLYSSLGSSHIDDEEFRVFDIRTKQAKIPEKAEKYIKPPVMPPRELRMRTDQDWSNVWPGPRTFHPASVPLPLRQGYDKRRKRVPPGKYANAELMKLPNFLHLTPSAIKKHCEALKKFCTPWPKGLETDEQIEKHFPLEVITTDYCHSSPKIRDPKARVVTLKFKLSRLVLNKHSKDKVLRLLGERHNPETDEVTLVTDRCPLRKQNYDYNMYLVLALYYESQTVECWEEEKCEEDMEYYDWERNPSKKAYLALKYWPKPVDQMDTNSISLDDDKNAQNYKQAVLDMFNEGETIHSLFNYKEAVLKIVL